MNSLRQLRSRLRRNQQGVTALEYALAAPLLLAVIFVAIEVAFIMLADAHLDVAANRVARMGRLGITGECQLAVDKVMNDTLSGWISDDSKVYAEAKVYTPGGDNAFGDVYDENYIPPECDSGGRGDMVIYRLGFDRPGLTGFISWLGLSKVRFERVVLIQNE
ncbi:pilus assembly protein [Brenneria goodwinii]|uniref:TadE-like domain-containing protein n=1 Tax=Brenneria goodwinii TaxID=1109412 RepID=A0A0G4JWT5_9GAMM|nr:TadE/TadG family type IV pilus assembly protein [Brenneria goodwinii]MCG8157095.1 pilus assembly protein [Brenneria goodwinii]MCG8160165.1 pilus assembly protein [Brenneria goodwinii]MCG8164688.1 pilus assembly protein [Brenneria goodwinii]MCG8170606.1 pilus assembly protein [Brenneria goodwinii]MCG8174134.1 pilus assembly protein [Brenneria goodwinii]